MHTRLPRIHRSGLIVGIIWLFFATTASLHASPPAAVTLLYFQGIGGVASVRLEWATASEFETAGFRIERSESQNGPFANLDGIPFIPAEGDAIAGATYEAIDLENITDGQIYWYYLVEIEYSGLENKVGPIDVLAGQPTATPSPSSTNTPQSGSNDDTNAQATSTPTVTPSSSSTPTPDVGETPIQTTTTASPIATATNPARDGDEDVSSLPQESTSGSDASPLLEADQILAQVPTSIDGQAYPIEQATPGMPPSGGVDINDEADTSSEPYPSLNATTDPESQNQSSGLTSPVDADSGARVLTQNQQEPEGPSSNTLLLWIGFFVAMVIFGVTVVGSIFVFSRKNNSED